MAEEQTSREEASQHTNRGTPNRCASLSLIVRRAPLESECALGLAIAAACTDRCASPRLRRDPSCLGRGGGVGWGGPVACEIVDESTREGGRVGVGRRLEREASDWARVAGPRLQVLCRCGWLGCVCRWGVVSAVLRCRLPLKLRRVTSVLSDFAVVGRRRTDQARASFRTPDDRRSPAPAGAGALRGPWQCEQATSAMIVLCWPPFPTST